MFLLPQPAIGLKLRLSDPRQKYIFFHKCLCFIDPLICSYYVIPLMVYVINKIFKSHENLKPRL